MKKYRVVATKQAQKDLRQKLAYIRNHLKNPQAVQSVYSDYKETRAALAKNAGSIHEPTSEKMKERDLRRINFRKHNYFMLFRVVENRAEITNIFHGSEDYENKLR